MRTLAPVIVRRLPKHRVYVEPFAGKASVYRRKKLADRSILIDKNCSTLNRIKVKGNTKKICGDYKLSHRYDSKGAFLNPPWEKHPIKYPAGLVRARDVKRFMDTLKGRIFLTYHDNEEARKLFCHKPYRCQTIRNCMGMFCTKALAVRR